MRLIAGTSQYLLYEIIKISEFHIDMKEHRIELSSPSLAQVKDLWSAILKVCPTLEKNKCRIYFRYKQERVLPVYDYLSLTAGLSLLASTGSNFIYFVRQDLWDDDSAELDRGDEDTRLILTLTNHQVCEGGKLLRKAGPDHEPVPVEEVRRSSRISSMKTTGNKKSVASRGSRRSVSKR